MFQYDDKLLAQVVSVVSNIGTTQSRFRTFESLTVSLPSCHRTASYHASTRPLIQRLKQGLP